MNFSRTAEADVILSLAQKHTALRPGCVMPGQAVREYLLALGTCNRRGSLSDELIELAGDTHLPLVLRRGTEVV
jgi:hypothetical protein